MVRNLCAGLLLVSSVCISANAAQRSALQAQHVPAAVADGSAARLGDLDPSRQMSIVLALPTRNQADLDQLLEDLQDPASPRYRQYLTPAQYTERYAATQQDYDKVVAFARANGFTHLETTGNRHLVIANSTVANVNRVFQVKMGVYQHPTESRTFFSADREPTVEGLDVPLVEIGGLNDMVRPHNHLRRGTDAQRAALAISHAGSGPSGEYLPSDMRAAYYGNGALTGAGINVAIVGYGNYVQSDLTLWSTNTGESLPVPISNPTFPQSTTACEGAGTTGTSCDDTEQTLDIEQVEGMAPGVNHIYFYAAEINSSSSDLPLINAIANDDLAQIVSCSWGWMPPTNQASEDASFQQMQAQGQTFLNATGDEGSYTTSNYAFPSADPYIMEVGGTDLTTNGAGGAWKSETAWPDSSGGYSPVTGFEYAIPSWQQLAGVINSSNKGSTTLRNDPDVAAEANFDNYICDDGSCSGGYGGTSFAAPRWAGYMALANQQAMNDGAGPIGFALPNIYAVGVGSSYDSNFHDITSGSNGAFNAVTGYDLVTGWGSPNGATLLNNLAAEALPTTITTLAATPNPATVGQAVIVTATVRKSSTAVPSGSVTFYYGSQALATSKVSSGTATLTASTATLPAAAYAITARYENGGASYAPSQSSAYTVTLNKATTQTTLAASPTSVTPPASVTLTAQATRSVGTGAPSGTVTFYYQTIALGTASLNTGGMATLTEPTTNLPAGSYAVTARYNGDAGDTPSTSAATTVTVK